MRPEHLPRPSVTFDSDPETGVIRFVLVSNGSLSRTQAHGVLLALGLFMTLIAGGFWAQGLWLVLPFSGLEWLTIAYALRWSLRNSEMMEVITIDPMRVMVERGRRRPEQRFEFQRAWVRLSWREPRFRSYPRNLELRSHGKQVVLGEFLPETERKKLMQELGRILKNQ
ncbi:MAG TPA: DUF2244 domain-containing protein [Methylococcaceae bacterium]|nr:DUF2244 domain-containing protein [Methylococcaceae bacterium]